MNFKIVNEIFLDNSVSLPKEETGWLHYLISKGL